MYLAPNSNYLEKLFKCLTFGGRSVSLVNCFVDVLNQVMEGSSSYQLSQKRAPLPKKWYLLLLKREHASKGLNGRKICRGPQDNHEFVFDTPILVS